MISKVWLSGSLIPPLALGALVAIFWKQIQGWWTGPTEEEKVVGATDPEKENVEE